MADHVQQQILEGVVAALSGASTSAGDRVFLDRLDVLQPGQLPAILVEEAPGGEAVAPQTVSGLQERDFQVIVRYVVTHASEYAKRARDGGAEVERVLGGRSFAVPKPGRASLLASRLSPAGEGDRAMAMREQIWSFRYYTQRGVPDVAR